MNNILGFCVSITKLLILILLTSCYLAGCSSGANIPNIGNTRSQIDSTNTLINADQQVTLSSGLDETNLPVDNLTIFNRNTQEIYATFFVYDNRDSDKATVTWLYEQAEIASFEIDIFIGYSETTPQTFYSLFTRPSGGFEQGSYYVVAIINNIELARAGFSIV